jgi:hypothetical protein
MTRKKSVPDKTSKLVLTVTRKEKTAIVRAAHPQTVSEWCMAVLFDAACIKRANDETKRD